MTADLQEQGSSLPSAAPRQGESPEAFAARLDAMPAGVPLLAALEGMDLDRLSAFERVEVVAQAARIEARAHAIKARAAAAVEAHPDMHHPRLAAVCRALPAGTAFVHAQVAAAELAMRLLVSEHEARLLIREGKAYAGPLADTGAALADGRIDVPRARAIVRRVGDEPAEIAAAVQAAVLPAAPGRTVTQVRADVERALHRVDPEHTADRHRAARAGRCVSRPKVLHDGMAGMWAVLPAAEAVRVDTVLDALARRAREAGDTRTLDQLRADAFVDGFLDGGLPVTAGDVRLASRRDGAHEDLAHQGPPGDRSDGAATAPPAAPDAPTTTARTVVHVTVPLTTLMGADDQPAELDGYGPIDATQARAMALDLGSTWRRLVTDPLSGTVLDVGRTTYRPPAALAEHVRHRDKYCAAPGCTVPAHRCDLDHTVAYDPPVDDPPPGGSRPHGSPPRPPGTTSADNLGPLCRHHHRLKTAGVLRLEQHTPGQFEWETLTGHRFTVRPGSGAPTLRLGAPSHPPAPPPF